MAANVNVTLTGGSLQALDLTTNLFRINDLLATLTLPSTDLFYNAYQQCAVSPGTVITLPSATVWFALVKNLSPSATLTVQHTAQGGAQVTAVNSLVLMPGGIWAYINNVETSGGLIGLALIGSATCPALVALAA